MKKIMAALTVLILVFSGCSSSQENQSAVDPLKNNDTIGNGSTSFALSIVDNEGEKVNVTVKTDKKTVGDALEELHIISGKRKEYGLYIETVNGITADYNETGEYWAFYIDDAYAKKSVSATEINPDSVYMLKVEKA